MNRNGIEGPMDPAFWQQRWQENKIAFHEGKPNALLSAHVHRLALTVGQRVFVPLCGKAHDLTWLVAEGYRVVGAELNLSAVEAAFDRMGLDPAIQPLASHQHYKADGIEIFVGDFFDLSLEMLGKVDAVYDRAALVALPPEMRKAYAAHLTALTQAAPQLLISFDYDQSQTEGPPFSVTDAEIGKLYENHYSRECLASVAIAGSLAQRCSGKEEAWLLRAI